MAAYAASKAGLIGLTQVLASEYGSHNIRVTRFCQVVLIQRRHRNLRILLRRKSLYPIFTRSSVSRSLKKLPDQRST